MHESYPILIRNLEAIGRSVVPKIFDFLCCYIYMDTTINPSIKDKINDRKYLHYLYFIYK